jgi:hypothetical protein
MKVLSHRLDEKKRLFEVLSSFRSGIGLVSRREQSRENAGSGRRWSDQLPVLKGQATSLFIKLIYDNIQPLTSKYLKNAKSNISKYWTIS